ncbi:MAG: CHRD domain-containing protein, partial [Actinomycetota bacterium]
LATVAVVASLLIVPSSGARPTKLTAPLRGSDSTDTDGRGRAVVRIDPRARTACFNLSWSNLDDQPFAAHIHEGGAGVDGGIVVHFFNAAAPDQPVPPGISGVSGCATNQNRATLREILDGPRGFYVNIHTESFPGGAIRGQLRRPR